MLVPVTNVRWETFMKGFVLYLTKLLSLTEIV